MKWCEFRRCEVDESLCMDHVDGCDDNCDDRGDCECYIWLKEMC